MNYYSNPVFVESCVENVCFFCTEAEVRVTAGVRPPCGISEEGQLWFNTLHRGLFLCDGMMWLTMLQGDELCIQSIKQF